MFSRTSSGIKNSHLFLSGFYVVIVEGSTDCSFWNNFFPNEINGYKIKLKPVGGRLEVQPYIDELLCGEAKFIVAIDSDYTMLLNSISENSRIVETRLHSIENLLLCPAVITSIVRNLSHDTEYEIDRVNNWLEHFDLLTYPLMIADIVIEKNKLEKKCVGESCIPFLIKEKDPTFDNKKITDFIEKLNLPKEDFNEMQILLGGKRSIHHIRGHFLLSAVLWFIRKE